MLFVTNPDIFCIPCKPRYANFKVKQLDFEVSTPDKAKAKAGGLTPTSSCFIWKFTNPRLTSPSGPMRYEIRKKKLYKINFS